LFSSAGYGILKFWSSKMRPTSGNDAEIGDLEQSCVRKSQNKKSHKIILFTVSLIFPNQSTILINSGILLPESQAPWMNLNEY
jgi:hypothetical protein